MNRQIAENINNFLSSVSHAGEALKKNSNVIETKDKSIQDIVTKFNEELQQMKIVNSKGEFAVQLEETLHQYKEKSTSWMGLVNTYMNGKEFINQFEKSMLVVVFGNVNVGKSSLGNFIAGVFPEEIRTYYPPVPDFYVYDIADSKEKAKPTQMEKKEFKENYREETSTIQYYTLNNGLTWVDSPGIHSINGENEALAKKYVDYADLVVFVMSSSSPAKFDEFQELSRLMEKQKPVLVVINKSDMKIEDEIDGEICTLLVPKSDQDRNKQEKYVQDLFANNKDLELFKKVDSISVSVQLARQGVANNDEEKFEQSGINRFYKELGVILKNDTVEVKMLAPRQRVNSVIRDIISGFETETGRVDGITDMKNSFTQILANIEDKISYLQKLEQTLLQEVRMKSIPMIDLELSKMSVALQSGQQVENVKQKVTTIILNNFNEIIQKQVSKVLSEFKHSNIQTLNMKMDMALEAKYETFSYTEYKIKEVKRDPKNLFEKIGSVFGKEYTSIKKSSNEIERKLLVGDNSGQMLDSIISNFESEFQPVVKETLQNIVVEYFDSEKAILYKIMDKLDEVEQKISNELMECGEHA
ncbi:MAG: 50S ribosome-binding GTPase [bacterium]|nr:50S ribosome-binding GTPase [bacterium]